MSFCREHETAPEPGPPRPTESPPPAARDEAPEDEQGHRLGNWWEHGWG